MDARLESANRASMLHRQRTGKSLHITKEIVENEAMYEEIDERYQKKRIRMLQAQNLQIEEQFRRQVMFAAFAANQQRQQQQHHHHNHSHSQGQHQQHNGVRKSSIDVNNPRSSIGGPIPATNTSAVASRRGSHQSRQTSSSPDYQLKYEHSPSLSSSPSSSPSPADFISSEFSPTSTPIPNPSSMPLPSYISNPYWQQPQQQQPINFWESPYTAMWQQQQQSSSLPTMPTTFSEGSPSSASSAGFGYPTTTTTTTTRNLSISVPSAGSTPLGTPDNNSPAFPSTPTSPYMNNMPVTGTTMGMGMGIPSQQIGMGGGPIKEQQLMVPNNAAGSDPDYSDFSAFAMSLENNEEQPPLEPSNFEDLISFDDYAAVA